DEAFRTRGPQPPPETARQSLSPSAADSENPRAMQPDSRARHSGAPGGLAARFLSRLFWRGIRSPSLRVLAGFAANTPYSCAHTHRGLPRTWRVARASWCFEPTKERG